MAHSHKQTFVCKPILHEFKRIGNRSYAKILSSEGIELWRTRGSEIGMRSWECLSSTCIDMTSFIELAHRKV